MIFAEGNKELAIQKLPFVNINHKYFESGQSEMEVDSVHFTIEQATKHSDMNISSEWYTAVHFAKCTQLKYEVIEVNTCNVLDVKEAADECFINKKSTDDRGSLSRITVK